MKKWNSKFSNQPKWYPLRACCPRLTGRYTNGSTFGRYDNAMTKFTCDNHDVSRDLKDMM